MLLELAALIPGTETPAGDGVSGALRCVLRLPDGSRCSAVLKRADLGEVIAEAFGALLLKAWNLPVPTPYLVDESGKIAFASADNSYPNLKQHLGLASRVGGPARDAAMRVAMALATSLPTAPLAAACDEAIANGDRNLGNILWDGSDEAWIDHALAFGRGTDDVNKLCVMAIGMPNEDHFSKSAIAQSLLLERDLPELVEGTVSRSVLGDPHLPAFVSGRLVALAGRLLARFPKPPDLLSSAL